VYFQRNYVTVITVILGDVGYRTGNKITALNSTGESATIQLADVLLFSVVTIPNDTHNI